MLKLRRKREMKKVEKSENERSDYVQMKWRRKSWRRWLVIYTKKEKKRENEE